MDLRSRREQFEHWHRADCSWHSMAVPVLSRSFCSWRQSGRASRACGWRRVTGYI